MKTSPSRLARTLERPAVIVVPSHLDMVHTIERWFGRIALVTCAVLAVAMLAACETTSTKFNGIWVNPDKTRAPAHSVLVIGVNRDATARLLYEEAVAANLAARGIDARVSYPLLPELGPTPPPGIENVVRATGVDAVLVSSTLRMGTDIRITPGYTPAGPWGLAAPWGNAGSVPPNVYTVEKVDVESKLYDANTSALLWTASSTTLPSASMQRTVDTFARLLVKALADAKLIA